MLYHSTRSKEKYFSSKDAILKGICQDGGLFISDDLGKEKIDLSGIKELNYRDLVFRVFSILIPDYTEDEILACAEKAYNGKFETEELTPLTKIGDQYLLELYHGPTQAFKDLALCMLPQLMSVALKAHKKKLMILTATSGDTGKAALSGFRDAENIGITVFYPYKKVSDIQYLQMVTQKGNNVAVAAVRGNFDDCQSGVKKIFTVAGKDLEERTGVSLSSANSINIGRLVPQVVYYFDCYRQLLKQSVISFGESVDFCVPTGNFGDVLAGWYAKQLGLPVGKLIVASNSNKVLFDFFETGVYDRNREFVKTISPSMDILISSNLERLLYYETDGNCRQISAWMEELKSNGSFTVPETVMGRIREDFAWGYAADPEAAAAIKEAFENDGRLIDPHTAVAYKVAKNRKKTVILSTASPFKFAEDVYTAIFGPVSFQNGFAYMKALSEKTGEPVPNALAELEYAPVLHNTVLNIDQMNDFITETVRKDRIQ